MEAPVVLLWAGFPRSFLTVSPAHSACRRPTTHVCSVPPVSSVTAQSDTQGLDPPYLQGPEWVLGSPPQPSASSSTQPGRPSAGEPLGSQAAKGMHGKTETSRGKGRWVGLQCVQKVRGCSGSGNPHSLEPRPTPAPTPSSHLQQGPRVPSTSPARKPQKKRHTDPSPAGGS